MRAGRPPLRRALGRNRAAPRQRCDMTTAAEYVGAALNEHVI